MTRFSCNVIKDNFLFANVTPNVPNTYYRERKNGTLTHFRVLCCHSNCCFVKQMQLKFTARFLKVSTGRHGQTSPFWCEDITPDPGVNQLSQQEVEQGRKHL